MAFYDLRWDLLQLIESIYGKMDNDEYISLMWQCPSIEWREALKTRFENT